ncbi:type IV pilin-like G/H family protein [Gloeocapsa sp. BRSZ]
MKTELKVKLLQHLSGKKKEQGFTLIELLVVIIIIGILSAIALPSFLNQSAKARASEARTNVGAMNRAQQTYYLENQKFASGDAAITNLGIGIKEQTDNYDYTAESTAEDEEVINRAGSRNKDLRSHIGGVFSVDGQTPSILCQAAAAAVETDTATDAPGLDADNAPECKGNTEKVGG